MSQARVVASPQAAEAATKMPRPTPKARRAPMRSERDPDESRNAANIRVYPSTIHCEPVIPPPRSCLILGKATFTTTASRVIMKKPSTDEARVRPARGAAGTEASGAPVIGSVFRGLLPWNEGSFTGSLAS